MFYVMPLLAGLAVYATYVLGAMLGGPLAGVLAALLIATSPAFVLQLTHAPMSDIAAAGWWASALILLPRVSRSSALVAGLAAGAAILTRPNLVPVALIPGCLLLWDLRAQRVGRRLAVERLLLFAGASISACLVIALLNTSWYGSPLQSGYGPLAGQFFQWDYGWPNLKHYWRWAIDSQTLLIVVAIAAPVLAWRHVSASTGRPMLVVVAGFVLGVYACYAFYLPFDDWWFLRFLLPAFPASFALMSVALVRLCGRLPRHARWLVPVILVAFAAEHSIRFGWANGAYHSASEWRFAVVGQYIRTHLPERAIFVASLHSGSARYYSGRMTIRYEFIPAERLDALLAHVERAGYSPFILVDDVEAPGFIASFSGRSSVGALDWPPIADVSGVKIYAASAKGR
jgi:4-amino-4-deoxy-L-arabinose transferase-like glycosyltransferase